MVLVLMGIIVSMMTISVGDGGKFRELEEEANRLRALIKMAREEAILRSQEWRIVFKEDAYQFEKREDASNFLEELKKKALAKTGATPQPSLPASGDKDDKGTDKPKWVPINDKIFRERELPGYRLNVIIEEEEYSSILDTEEDEPTAGIGSAHIYYSGEIIPFEVTIEQENGEDKFTLKVNAFGEVEMTNSRDDKS